MTYDVIVVGAGPAGSTAARETAEAGVRVLLLDKARFPRDKPCGGGVNVRAANLLPFSLAPVTERTITSLRVSLNLRGSVSREYDKPLCYMTQRSVLDAYLVEQAVAAGAELHDGEPVRAVETGNGGVTVRTAGTSYHARAVVGADGANGVVARSTDLDGGRDHALALEANYHCSDALRESWRDAISMDLGLIPGGYGWLFPKEDHLNIGVGGWKHFAPSLRGLLEKLAAQYGLQRVAPRNLRGHHLPIRRPGAPLAGGPALLVGDAAGLIDPLSGEGIYAAIYSGRLAASQLVRYLAGDATDLSGYAHAVEARLARDLLASQRFQDVFHLMPSVYVQLLQRSDLIWNTLCHLVRGEQTYLGLRRRIGPMASLVDLLSYTIRRTPLRARVGLPPKIALES